MSYSVYTQPRLDDLNHLFPIPHRPDPSISTRELLRYRNKHLHPASPLNTPLFQDPQMRARDRVKPHSGVHRGANDNSLPPTRQSRRLESRPHRINHPRRVPSARNTQDQRVRDPRREFRERIRAQRRDHQRVRPPSKLNVQDRAPASPGLGPFVCVAEDVQQVWIREGGERWLFCGLRLQE